MNPAVSDICFFFGTFNPVHYGHLLMAEVAREQFGFKRVVFIPASVPPHRQEEAEMASFAHRFHMVVLACEDNPFFEVSDVESQRPGPSYTVETLRLLLSDWETSSSKVPLMIGADALQGLGSWHQPHELLQKGLFFQAARESAPLQQSVVIHGETYPLETRVLDMPQIGISSTLIRQRLQAGLSIRYFTPPAVAAYIGEHKLYLTSC